MEDTSTNIIRYEPNKTIFRKNFRRVQTDAKYKVYKINNHIALTDYVTIHRLFLDPRHATVFTLILNARKTVQCIMVKGILTYVTGRGQVNESTLVMTKPGLITFELPGIGFGMKFHISEPTEIIFEGKKYTNVYCICRQYF